MGVTDFEPLDETVPTPGLMETDVALLTFQDKVADWPALMEAGLALKLLMDGRLGAFTVTVIHERVEPEMLAAVRV